MSTLTRAIAAIAATGFSGVSLMAGATTVLGEDFQSGNPFATSYLPAPVGISSQPGHFRVTSDPGGETDFIPNGYGHLYDHTLGTAAGKMLFFDGGSDPTSSIWSATVALTQGVSYLFSFWTAAAVASSAPVLGFSVGGEAAPTTITAVDRSWLQYSFSFMAPTSTETTLSIFDTNVEPIGNDGAIDDILLTATSTADPGPSGVPEPQEAALIAGGLGILGFMTRRRTRKVTDSALALSA